MDKSDATSNYQSVTVNIRSHDFDEAASSLEELLLELRDERNSERIVVEISNLLKRFHFSPFAECLPDNLYVSAIVEENLDCEGLLEFLRKTQIKKK